MILILSADRAVLRLARPIASLKNTNPCEAQSTRPSSTPARHTKRRLRVPRGPADAVPGGRAARAAVHPAAGADRRPGAGQRPAPADEHAALAARDRVDRVEVAAEVHRRDAAFRSDTSGRLRRRRRAKREERGDGVHREDARGGGGWKERDTASRSEARARGSARRGRGRRFPRATTGRRAVQEHSAEESRDRTHSETPRKLF